VGFDLGKYYPDVAGSGKSQVGQIVVGNVGPGELRWILIVSILSYPLPPPPPPLLLLPFHPLFFTYCYYYLQISAELIPRRVMALKGVKVVSITTGENHSAARLE